MSFISSFEQESKQTPCGLPILGQSNLTTFVPDVPRHDCWHLWAELLAYSSSLLSRSLLHRVKRGLWRSCLPRLVNADDNGSTQPMLASA